MQEPQEMQVWSLGGEDPLEKGKATHSSVLVWRTPWTGEAGKLQSVGSPRVGHDWSSCTLKRNFYFCSFWLMTRFLNLDHLVYTARLLIIIKWYSYIPSGFKIMWFLGIPWLSSGHGFELSLQGAWVQSLVRELRSHMPHGKREKNKMMWFLYVNIISKPSWVRLWLNIYINNTLSRNVNCSLF